MDNGEIAAWIAALFAAATFVAWTVDKIRAHRDRPRSVLHVALIGNVDITESGRLIRAEVVKISNTGDAPATVELGISFRGARLVLREGFELPGVIPAGEACRLLLTDVDPERAHVVVTTRHPRFRWYYVEWFPLDFDSPLRLESERQIDFELALPKRKLRRYTRSGAVGPDGVSGVSIKTRQRDWQLDKDVAQGLAPVQPYKNWLQRSSLAEIWRSRTWLRRASSEASTPGPRPE